MAVKAYAYILSMGAEGLKKLAKMAVLRELPHGKARRVIITFRTTAAACMNVFSRTDSKKHHVSTLDISKRLIEYRVHPPRLYFPLVVKGALMMEPTETESKENLDGFVGDLIRSPRKRRSTRGTPSPGTPKG